MPIGAHGAPRGARLRLLTARTDRQIACAMLTTNLGRHVARWGLLAALVAGCSVPSAGQVEPHAQITPSKIDDGTLVILAGNTHPAAIPSASTGPMKDDFLIEHMQLVLKRAPDHEAALVAHIDALHDKTSPLYHQWLTAEEFGDQYGVAKSDIAAVTGWLRAHGFHVDGVPVSRMFIEFTGTVAQVNAAFHTQIHQLSVEGKLHFANMSDPQIPKELAKVVVGIHSLHNFMPHPMHKLRGQIRRDHTTGAWRTTSPDFDLPNAGQCETNAQCAAPASGTCNTTTGTCACTTNAQCPAMASGTAGQCSATTGACMSCLTNADCIYPRTCNPTTFACDKNYYVLAPADFAAIYNLNPLFAEGITGQNHTVVVLEDTFLANPSDVTTFWTAFGLSGYKGTFSELTPTGAATCTSPTTNADEVEAALDAEWAGASAPGANIVMAACADQAGNNTMFGGYLALENLVNGASPPEIVSLSYGECESGNTVTANQAYSQLYQQAVAEGVSVFVSAGDEGAASCDANRTFARSGIAVSGFASTAYNVAVGGTDFADYYIGAQGGPPESTYWSATNSAAFGSALGYVPEIPWNNSCASPTIYGTPAKALGTYTQAYGATGFCNSTVGTNFFRTTGAGSGGPSNNATAAGVGWPQPSWQTGVVGLPSKSGGVRVLPDVSLFAANGTWAHFLSYCMSDTTQQGGGTCDYTNEGDALALGAGGTSFASPALAGIQALINQKMGGPQGNPNYTYYKLAAAEQGATGSKRCNSTGGTPASPRLPAEECIFNDVTQGDIDVNCANRNATTTAPNCFGQSGSGATAVDGSLSPSSTTYSPAYPATTGWDYATGLGTVNAFNLVNAWSQ